MMLVLSTFVGVLAVVLGAYWLFVVRLETGAHRAMQKRLRPQEQATRKSKLTLSKSEQRELGVSLFAGLQSLIDQSGRKTSVPRVLFTCFMSGFVTAMVMWIVIGGAKGALVVGVVAAAAPYLLLKRAAAKRMWKFEEQFPDAIDLIARALRAGHAFPPGLAMVAEELGDPVGPEFKLLYDRQNFGMPLPEAMRSFAARVPVIDAKFFVTAVLTQREAGGNLSGVLDNLSAVIRERFKVKRQVGVISAHGRMTAIILSGLPPVIGAALFVITPQNALLLIREPLGIQMLIGAGVLQLLGMLWIRKIIKIDY
jgi:tight adherence protein B